MLPLTRVAALAGAVWIGSRGAARLGTFSDTPPEVAAAVGTLVADAFPAGATRPMGPMDPAGAPELVVLMVLVCRVSS